MKGNEQNGCQPSVSRDVRSSAPVSDQRTRNASLTTHEHHNSICRDFIWGICTKGSRCAFRHERDVECMKTILKFCHNFQNKTGCTRADCTYLHASREEQASFLNLGQIPKVLAERYAAMSNSTSNPGNVNITHGGEAHSPRGAAAAYPVSPTITQPLRAVMPPLLVPPPPPPLPVPVPTTPVQSGPSAYPAALQHNVSPVQQTRQQFTSLPAKFDATKPPPPLPTPARLSRKRSGTSPVAGPSKARKLEENVNIDNMCDNCVQRQIRVELIRQDLQNYQTDKDCKTDLYTKKCEDYEHGKLLMRSIVNTDLYQFLEDYIEEDSTPGPSHQEQAQFSHVSSLATGITSPNKPFMRQLLERVFENGTRNLMEPPSMPANNLDNPILKSLTSFARSRVAPVKKGTAEVFQTLLDLMCDRNSTEHGNDISESRINDILSLESLPSSSSFSSVITGFTQFINSGKAKSPSPEVNFSSTLSSPTSMSPPPYSSPVIGVPNNLISSPPPQYVPFQPNVPPPRTRPMFPPPMGSVPTGIQNTIPYNPAVRMGGSPTMTTRPPAVGSNSPTQQPGQNVVRYPGSFPMQPHYYPPYQ